MKSRIQLQDDLDMLEAAANGIRYPGPGSQALLAAIDELLHHPFIDPRDKPWLEARLNKLRVRHGLPMDDDQPHRYTVRH